MLEIIAVIFTLLSVWLTRKQNIWCWLTGIIGTGAFYFVFKADNSVANMNLQVLFILQGVYGWMNWGKKDKMAIALSDSLFIAIEVSLTLLIASLLYALLFTFNLNLSFLDISTTALSIMGMALISHKRLESWFFWMGADFLYIIYFLITAHFLSALLFLVLFINAFFGFREWKKEILVKSIL